MCCVDHTGDGEREVWTELDPDCFRPFCIPFYLTGTTLVGSAQEHSLSTLMMYYSHFCTLCSQEFIYQLRSNIIIMQENPCELPGQYREALDRRKQSGYMQTHSATCKRTINNSYTC